MLKSFYAGSDVSMDEYYSGAMGDYYEVINYNRELIDENSVDVMFGFYFFVFGLVLTLMTIISVVLL